MTSHRIVLGGCQPEPLLSYLKALGLLRLLAEQADPHARGAWSEEGFVLHTVFDADVLRVFFLNDYRPTPIMAPWNGGGGFLGKKARHPDNDVEKIARSSVARLAQYRDAIAVARDVLRREGVTEKSSGDDKDRLLRIFRREMPDEFIAWMDAVLVIQQEGQKYPPLMGTGGNDGNFEFSLNFMQRLIEIGLHGVTTDQSKGWLETALFGTPARGLPSNAVGQFDPGRAGGLNMTTGLKGASFVNPWDFVLMLEGALLFAGSATRRMDAKARDKAAFPFTVNAVAVGNGTLAEGENVRGEIWLPLWSRPAGISELRHVLGEGRAQVGRRQAGNAVDFARAAAGLGIDRGFTAFTRFSFLERSGRTYLAVPLGRFAMRQVVDDVRLLDEIDGWLESLRRACRGDSVPARFTTALRGLEGAIFDYCRFGGAARFGGIVRCLGACQRELSRRGNSPGKIGESDLWPVPLLSAEWLIAAYEDSPEFRIALALASIRRSGDVPELRGNVEAVVRERSGWRWAGPEEQYGVVWRSGGLVRNLSAVLERRLLDASRFGADPVPLEARFPASAADVALFLDGRTDDVRIEEWMWGLMSIDLDRAESPSVSHVPNDVTLPRPYALLKLLFLPRSAALKSGEGAPLPAQPTLLAHLRAGRVNDACRHAARRLRASGYVAMPAATASGGERTVEFTVPVHVAPRLAGALLIPNIDVRRLQTLVLRPKEKTQ